METDISFLLPKDEWVKKCDEIIQNKKREDEIWRKEWNLEQFQDFKNEVRKEYSKYDTYYNKACFIDHFGTKNLSEFKQFCDEFTKLGYKTRIFEQANWGNMSPTSSSTCFEWT
jgi:hypothetical protein